MTRIPYGFLLAFLLVSTVPATAHAENASTDPDSTQTDVRDLWRMARHRMPIFEETFDDGSPPHLRPLLVVVPSFSSKPSTGATFGAGATLVAIEGDPATTHLSRASASLRMSVKGQMLSSVRFGMFSSDDRWFVQGENRFWWTSLNTRALGVDDTSGTTNLKFDWFRFYDTAYRRIGDTRWFVGMGLNVSDHGSVRAGSSSASFDQSAYTQYSDAHGLGLDKQVSGGTNAAISFDSRDNAINPEHGWLASATFRTFFDGFLGGSSTWQELNVDLRTYRPLTSDARHRIAFWLLGDVVTGGTAPFLDLPATAEDIFGRSARGYSEGQFRGPRLVYGEAEYRGSVTSNGLLGVVAFANVTTVDGDQPGQRLFRSFAPAGGGGLRVLLDKKTRTNLALDYGFGINGSRGLYIAVQEAF